MAKNKAHWGFHAEPSVAEFYWDQLADSLAAASEEAGIWEVGHDFSELHLLIEQHLIASLIPWRKAETN